MGTRLWAFSLILVASLYGQRRHSWQDDCFKNPGLPYCQGRDYAVKKPKPTQASPTVVTNPGARVLRTATPSLIVIGGIDWRFADPSADALIGINYRAFSASPAGVDLLAQLAAGQSLGGLSQADQIAISVRDNKIVALITGAAQVSPQSGLKVAPVSAKTILIGDPNAVDQAVQRLAMKAPLNDLVQSAEERHGASEFWAIASPRLIGSQALTAGVKRFDLNLSLQSPLTSDLTIEFDGTPNPATIRAWQTEATMDGNVAHLKMSMENQSPVGQRLAALVQTARYLQAPEPPKHTKPVIYGLDGGPKEVN